MPRQLASAKLRAVYPFLNMKASLLALLLIGLVAIACTAAASTPHTFVLGKDEFLLDGKPFVIRSGEMHPARIPFQYWRHRIQMAKAMGLNTIAIYVFWNYHEQSEGVFDFKSENRDLAKFFALCKEEGLWVLLRPGPYCCGEWDFGGIPPYLLRYPDIKVRCSDSRYVAAASRYLSRLAKVVEPFQITRGGPILMVQIENEYGSYGNDRSYIAWLHDFWRQHGIDVPMYTADGPTDFMLEAGSYPGCAVGLDSGSSEADWQIAKKMRPGVPVFSSETYPGWLTHWGEAFATNSIQDTVKELGFLIDNRKSFNLYVVHGGTNFGLTAGANSGGKGYEPTITSYDYDAPINEQGRPTPKFMAMRDLIGKVAPLPPVPAPIPTMTLPPIEMMRWTSVWDHLPKPILSPQPKTFESLGQNQGLVLYRTHLIGHKAGSLTVNELHDWALVYLDGKFVGTLDRRTGIKSLVLPKSNSGEPILDILVESMGHINFGQDIIDRKGITDRVTLNGMTLMSWQIYLWPLQDSKIAALPPSTNSPRKGIIFKGHFQLSETADTYLDLSHYQKGYVWVNGHNLGRYWNIGPQNHLYCPAPFLKKGQNEVDVLDLLQEKEAPIGTSETLL